MSDSRRSERSLRWVILFLLLAAILAGLQVWNAVAIRHAVDTVITASDPGTAKADLDREKTRQELISKQIENQTKGALAVSLTAGLSAAIAALAAIMGAILTLRGYLDAREKERLDRLGSDLNETIAQLVSNEWRQRVVGSAGLLPFFSEDRKDFHLQAFSALVAAARIEDQEAAVRQGVRLAFERAVRVVSTDVLSEVSWQGVRLREVNLAGASLINVDLRDADLQNGVLDKAVLDGANLTNAKLQGVRFNEASLVSANLTYADLAGASLHRATMSGANLSHAKVLNLDLDEADMREIGAGWRTVPWDATRNWRNAKLVPSVARELDKKYGSSVPAVRVFMLMWELPPLVAGGTWTACYHLLRNLRRRGADVTVVVPWAHELLANKPLPFGIDVPIETLGINPGHWEDDQQAMSPYGGTGARFWSPYGTAGSWSPYGGGAGWNNSPYGSDTPYLSAYGMASRFGVYGAPYGPYGSGPLTGSVLFRLISEFSRRLCDFVTDKSFDLIHAHDWVTFDAARTASVRADVPWIAHFHSTEAERQPGMSDPLTQRIEQGAVDSASKIVTVSNVTKNIIAKHYDPSLLHHVDVIPNCLSDIVASPADMGRFESHRVVFLGRLSRQKGVDRFGQVADHVRDKGFRADFVAYGDGPERMMSRSHHVSFEGPLDWDNRGRAFRGASAVVVPSRAEPFGMVILEAMQHRVPVIYAEDAGSAEVLSGGVKVDANDIGAMGGAVMDLLGDLGRWESSVTEAAREIESYPERRYEDWLIAVWTDAVAKGASVRN